MHKALLNYSYQVTCLTILLKQINGLLITSKNRVTLLKNYLSLIYIVVWRYLVPVFYYHRIPSNAYKYVYILFDLIYSEFNTSKLQLSKLC